MKEILTANGWRFSHQCNTCGGNAEFWVCDYTTQYVFKLYTRQNYYLLIHNNRQIHRGNVNDIQTEITKVRQSVPQ